MLWRNWVVDFLKQRHAASPKTLQRKLSAWGTLAAFLDERKILTPAQITRQDCFAYLDWRRAMGNLLSRKKRVAHNTILLELKILASIVQEAVRREFIKGNPCFRLEIAREVPREKPELTDEHVRIIRHAIARRLQRAVADDERRNAHFLHVSFEIALAQGCRMSETHIDLDDVDLANMEVAFLAKGRKRYVAPLSPALVPLFRKLKAQGRRFTYDLPRMPTLVWFKFMDRLRQRFPVMRPISFHSSRVTVISRLGRADVPESVAMTLVNHASTTVHRIYRRVKKSELKSVWSALSSLADGRAARGDRNKRGQS